MLLAVSELASGRPDALGASGRQACATKNILRLDPLRIADAGSREACPRENGGRDSSRSVRGGARPCPESFRGTSIFFFRARPLDFPLVASDRAGSEIEAASPPRRTSVRVVCYCNETRTDPQFWEPACSWDRARVHEPTASEGGFSITKRCLTPFKRCLTPFLKYRNIKCTQR